MASAHRYGRSRADGSTGRAWRAKWTGADGRPESKCGFDRKGDAETYARDHEAEVRHGVVLEEPLDSITVAAWAETWRAGLAIRDETAASYDYVLPRILPAFGSRALTTLRQSEIRA